MSGKKTVLPDVVLANRLCKTDIPFKAKKRFFRFVDPQVSQGQGACWLWTGHTDDKGYGTFHIGHGRKVPRSQWAHRVSFAMHNGEIPEGMSVHHSCCCPSCVNPSHLSLATFEENTKEMNERRAAAKKEEEAKPPWEQQGRPSPESQTVMCPHCHGTAVVARKTAECLNCGKNCKADGKPL